MLAHASIDENGNIVGGTAGDQTGKEVCIRSNYTNNWTNYIEIQNDAVRIAFGNHMIDCARNDNIGYNQSKRNSLLTRAEEVEFDFTKITKACDCDCSSLVTIALLGAIYQVLGKSVYEVSKNILVQGGNCATTTTLLTRLMSTSLVLKTRTSTTYTNTFTSAVFGAIYLRTGKHVAVYVGDGAKVSVSDAEVDADYYPKYNGTTNSIVMALSTIGVDYTMAHRKEIAEANGITNYTGTAEQNTKLLNLLKAGKLKKCGATTQAEYYPKYTGSSSSIVDALLAVGAGDGIITLDDRKIIAEANGISGYTGTAEQNIQLLNLLKAGKLKKRG